MSRNCSRQGGSWMRSALFYGPPREFSYLLVLARTANMYFHLSFADLMIGDHFANSANWSAARASGDRPALSVICWPAAFSFFATPSSSSVRLNAAARFATVSRGVPLGAPPPVHDQK